MPLYIVVNSEGHQQRVSTQPLAPNDGEELLMDANLDAEPSALTHAWNPVTRVYESLAPAEAAPISRTRLSRREFRARLGQSCRVQINARLITPPANAGEVQLVAMLQDMKDELLSVDFVDVLHPTTIAAVGALAQIGYLTAEQAAAALAPSTVAEE